MKEEGVNREFLEWIQELWKHMLKSMTDNQIDKLSPN